MAPPDPDPPAGTDADANADADTNHDADSAVAALDLTTGEYQVEQHLVRNKYAVYDPDGELAFRAKQKLFRAREEFPFVDADGDPIFRVKAAGILDIAGDYELVDERSGEVIAVLSKQFSIVQHAWTIKTPDGGVIAEVRSASYFFQVLRNLVGLATLIPNSYVITAPDGREMGEIEGQFSVRDRYALRIEDTGDAPAAALVASVVAIDALEGN